MYFVKEFWLEDGVRIYVGIRKEMVKMRNYILEHGRFMGREIVGTAGLEQVPKGTVLGIELRRGVDGLYYATLKTVDVLGTMLYTHNLEESNRWDVVSFEELAMQSYTA